MPHQALSLKRRAEAGSDYGTRLDELRALVPELPAWRPGEAADDLVPILVDLLERKQRHLIEDNVRLAALRELTETLLRDPDEERVLRTICLYLRHAYGLDEVILLSFDDEGDLRGYRSRATGYGLCEAVRWSSAGLKGTAWETASGGTAVNGIESGGHPSGTPPPLPVILPLRAASCEEDAADKRSPVMGLLALRPDARTGAGTDPLEIEQLAFQAGTLLESVRHQQRAARERRFRECLFEAMDDALIATDQHGRITAANPASERMLVVSSEELLGRGIDTLLDRSPGLVELVSAALTGAAGRSRKEISVTTAEEVIPVNASVVPLADGEDLRGVVATMSDLRALRSMEEQVRRLDRLAALGRFASAVAHEIRNPLAAIGAGVQFLASSIPQEQHEHVRFLRAEVTRLDRIVRDLLEPAQNRPLMKDRIDVSELVGRACMAVEPLARERSVRFAVHAPPEEAVHPTRVDVDTDRLLQVLVNLIRNAVEAAPTDSEIRVAWDLYRRSEPPGVRITVVNGGPGIPPESLEHLFEPFYTTKPKGTGLGLYVSRGIVERHGGALWIEPGESGGTRACVELPGPSQEHNKGEH